MENVFLRYIPLPATVKGLTIQDSEGNYNVYLNARLTHEANLDTFQHEIQHIRNDDFSKYAHIREIERR